jgi:hypothetical protein
MAASRGFTWYVRTEGSCKLLVLVLSIVPLDVVAPGLQSGLEFPHKFPHKRLSFRTSDQEIAEESRIEREMHANPSCSMLAIVSRCSCTLLKLIAGRVGYSFKAWVAGSNPAALTI